MDIQDVWHEMARRHSCMLVDMDGGRLRARPMAPVAKPEDGAVWFVTDAASSKDDEIQRNPQVCLTFADEGDRFYLSVSGEAEVLRDREKLRQIWSSAMEAYFPNGPDDPDALLLKVTPVQAEMWQGDGTLTTGFKMASAILRQERADLGEHAKFRM